MGASQGDGRAAGRAGKSGVVAGKEWGPLSCSVLYPSSFLWGGSCQRHSQQPQRSSRAGGAARSAPGVAAHYPHTKRVGPGPRLSTRWLGSERLTFSPRSRFLIWMPTCSVQYMCQHGWLLGQLLRSWTIRFIGMHATQCGCRGSCFATGFFGSKGHCTLHAACKCPFRLSLPAPQARITVVSVLLRILPFKKYPHLCVPTWHAGTMPCALPRFVRAPPLARPACFYFPRGPARPCPEILP